MPNNPDEQIAALKSEMSEVYQANERTAAERDEVYAANERLADEFDRLQQQLAQLKTTSDAESQRLHDQLAEARDTNTQLNARIQELVQAQSDHRSERASLQDRVEVATREFTELNSQFKLSQSRVTELESEQRSLQHQLEQAEAQSRSVTASAADQKSAAESELRELKESSEKQIAELSLLQDKTQNQLFVAQQESERLRLRIDTLEKEAGVHQEELDAQLVALKDSESHWKSRAGELASLAQSADTALSQSREEWQRKLNELVSQTRQTKAKLAVSEQTSLRLRTRIDQLESEVARNRHNEMQANADEANALKERIRQLESLADQRADDYKDLQQSYALVQYWLEQERLRCRDLKQAIVDAQSNRPSQRQPAGRQRNNVRISKETSTAKQRQTNNKRSGNPATAKQDLCKIEGIGPKICALLNQANIKTFRKLSSTSTTKLQTILADAGPRFKGRDVTTWPKQAKLAADQRWSELEQLQAKLGQ